MKTSNYFVKRNSQSEDLASAIAVISGKYGNYARINGINWSEKELAKFNYTIEPLTKNEYNEIISNWKNKIAENVSEYEAQKLYDRSIQIDVCLASAPIEISLKESEICLTANLSNTKMIEAYHGSGKGTAYTKDGKLIAFHYGYQQPDNAPKDCIVAKVMMSCTQVCF